MKISNEACDAIAEAYSVPPAKQPRPEILVAKRRIFEPVPEAYIYTPMGPYMTSAALAEALNVFYKETEVPLERQGAIGGQFSYTFTHTSLGTILVVSDNSSGREINVTNFADF
jgi:hypothetical protein